jgi:hypothetical protein
MTLRKLTLHPFLFAAYAVLSLLAFNIDQIAASQAVRALAIALVASGGIMLVAWLFLRDWLRASLFTSLVVVLFFSYGHVYQLLEGAEISSWIVGRHRFLVILWLAAFIVGTWWIVKRSGQHPNLNYSLNIIAAIAILFPIYQLISYNVRSQRAENALNNRPPPQTSEQAELAFDQYPDIYYIILDAYAREDVLEELYGFDNSEFIESLESLGFNIADESHSNYTQTSLSLASTLNMDYVDSFISPLNPGSKDLTPLGAAIQNNAVRQILEDLGYTTVAFGTGFSRTELPDADIYLALSPDALKSIDTFGSVNMFEGMLIQTSATVIAADALQSLQDELQPDLEFPFREHRERILYAFDNVAELPETDQPKFVFVHIVSPHPPFVFGPNGEEIRNTGAYTLKDGAFIGDRDDYVQAYLDQLQYLNQRTLTALQEIIATSERPVLILLQSDHGADASSLPSDDPSPLTYLDERLSILNAYYLPGCAVEDLISPSITPVNSFRALFQACFGMDTELLQDRVFNSVYGAPYSLSEVTDELR